MSMRYLVPTRVHSFARKNGDPKPTTCLSIEGSGVSNSRGDANTMVYKNPNSSCMVKKKNLDLWVKYNKEPQYASVNVKEKHWSESLRGG